MMSKFKSPTVLAFLGIVFGISLLVTPKPAYTEGGPEPKEVKVVNSLSMPVPVAAQGTTQISGTVGIGSQPPMTLASGATVGIDSARNQVRIADSTPLLSRDIDNPARQPLQYMFRNDIADGESGTTAFFTVPADKRLVIEYVSGHFQMPAGQNVLISVGTKSMSTIGTVGSGGAAFGLAFHFFNPTVLGSVANDPSTNHIVLNTETKIYADPGSEVHFAVTRTGSMTRGGSARIALSGYLTDVQ